MNDEEVIRKLRQKIATQSQGRFTVEEIDPRGSLYEQGYLDSISFVEFIAFVETTYGLRVSDEELLGTLGTIEAIANEIARRGGAPS